MNYREIYANAIAQLGDTYGTPAYAQAKENYYKVFEMLAGANAYWIIEDDHPYLEELYDRIDEELVKDNERSLEILERANYPQWRLDQWKWDCLMIKIEYLKREVERISTPA